jgi:hypothetical protein
MPRAEPPTGSEALTEALLDEAEIRSTTEPQEQQGQSSQQRGHRLSAGSGEVEAWLMSHGLDMYTVRLVEGGYSRLVLFSGMDDNEVDTVIAENKMPRPHARAFKGAVQELRPRAAPGSVQLPQSGGGAINESVETGQSPASVETVLVQAVPVAKPTPIPRNSPEIQSLPALRPASQSASTDTPRRTDSTRDWVVFVLIAFSIWCVKWGIDSNDDPFLNIMCGNSNADAKHCTSGEVFHYPPQSDPCWQDVSFDCKGTGDFPCCGDSCKLPSCGCTVCKEDGSNSETCQTGCQQQDECPQGHLECNICCDNCGACCKD